MAACSEYRTLKAPCTASFREKMSKFIAFAEPVTTAAQAKEMVARIVREYHDARHVCWAYCLGADASETMVNDNGEPSGTAGKPILGQIRSAEITNVVIAVVRYFGGIKLGTSGLIAAYREAARMAIEAGEIVTAYETDTLTFTFPYISTNSVMKIVRDSGAEIVDRQFDNSCSMTLSTRADAIDTLTQRLQGVDGVTIHQSSNQE